MQDEIRAYYESQYTQIEPRNVTDLKRTENNLRGLHLQSGLRILDVGCGMGTTCLYMLREGMRAFGLDLSFQATLSATRLCGKENFFQSNAQILPLADASFDGATFMGTLEHFPNVSSQKFGGNVCSNTFMTLYVGFSC